MSGALGRIGMKPADSRILFYHRIAEGVHDPFTLCVTPARFAAHLDEIGRYGEPSTLAELSLPSLRPRIVVTFDDGYADNLINAVPIAEAKGVPITIFVTSGALGSQSGFWWDRLGTLLRSRPTAITEITLPAGEGTVRIGLGSSTRRKDLQSVRRHLLPLPVAEIHRVLDAVSEQWEISAPPPPDARTLTPSEFVQLAASDVVTIGDHTVDHVRLRGLEAVDQQQMISSSKEQLERLGGQTVLHFAYPFGGKDAFDDHSVDAVRSAGFETACTTIPGNANSTSDPFRLPRRAVKNWSRLRFRVALERWRLVPRH
jgi:peptidoglycan/xylan/chitin deacetylase (PgdA/CDA1 family)